MVQQFQKTDFVAMFVLNDWLREFLLSAFANHFEVRCEPKHLMLLYYSENPCIKADFYSVEFSDWTGNPLLLCENVAMNMNRMFRVTKILLSKIPSARLRLFRLKLHAHFFTVSSQHLSS